MSATIHQLKGAAAPSLDPLIALVAADLNHVNAGDPRPHAVEVALIPALAGHLIAGRGQAHAADADAGLRAAARLSRQPPPQARRRG
jgi:hypothetical protein